MTINLKLLDNLESSVIAHGNTKKYVFLDNSQLINNLTQIAYASFNPGESCELHEHPTMFEYFFFISGTGIYTIDEIEYKISSNTFLEIPPKSIHKLTNNGLVDLKFVYWGIAI
ncbi:MAG: cupin domain-containing protein [Prolixibacteraceae bacterium]